jgi:hypothetical protein
MEVVVAAGLEAEELSPSPPQAANKKAASIATTITASASGNLRERFAEVAPDAMCM